MKILTNGCSFAQGDELKTPETSRFSHLVAQNFNAEDINIARSGNSNHMIVHSTLDYLRTFTVDLVHISITYFERFMLPMGKSFLQINPTSKIDRVYDTLAQYIYSNSDAKLWYEYNYNLYYLLNDYCRSRSIPIVYSFVTKLDKSLWLRYSDDSFSLLNIDPMVEATRGLPQGKGYHPLEDGHRHYASLIIQAMDTSN